MADRRERERRRAGSGQRDQKHRAGGDWTSLTIPEGMELWQPNAGSNRIDIVPFEVQSNPYAEPGEWYWERTYFRHRAVGPENSYYVCLARTFSEPCPICDFRSSEARSPDADEKMLDQLKPQERQLFLVFDHKEPDKGVQLFEFSHWNFGKLLDTLRREADDDEGYIRDFDDERAGASLKVTFTEEKMSGYSFKKAVAIDFRPRPKGLDPKLLEHGVCLDLLPKKVGYDELKRIFMQTGGSEDADRNGKPANEQPQRRGRARQPAPPPEPEPAPAAPTADALGISRLDEVAYGGQDCTVVKISPDGTLLTLLGADDEPIRDVPAEDVRKGAAVAAPETGSAPAAAPADDAADPDRWDDDWD